MRELLEVVLGEALQPLAAFGGEVHPHHPRVARILAPHDEPRGGGSVHELDPAVVAQEQIFGEVPDRGSTGAIVTSDGEQKLVLGGGQARRLSLARAPAQKASQPSAQLEQVPVVAVG